MSNMYIELHCLEVFKVIFLVKVVNVMLFGQSSVYRLYFEHKVVVCKINQTLLDSSPKMDPTL